MQVTGLNVHPVKSTAIRPVPVAAVGPQGLVEDRTWVVVDGEGVALTAREVHDLFRVVADTPATERSVTSDLRLTAHGRPPVDICRPSGAARTRVRLHRHELEGLPASDDAHAWLRETLGRDDVRLVWCDDPTRRGLNPARSRPGDHTAFADAYPVSIATEASLRRLRDWIAETALERGEEPGEPLPMQRFRPNIVLDGDEPFAEDDWTAVEIGDGDDAVRLRVPKPVDRCVMTMIDPASLTTGPEPIRTLSRHRRPVDVTLFAMFAIPEGGGRVRIGDPVRVETR